MCGVVRSTTALRDNGAPGRGASRTQAPSTSIQLLTDDRIYLIEDTP